MSIYSLHPSQLQCKLIEDKISIDHKDDISALAYSRLMGSVNERTPGHIRRKIVAIGDLFPELKGSSLARTVWKYGPFKVFSFSSPILKRINRWVNGAEEDKKPYYIEARKRIIAFLLNREQKLLDLSGLGLNDLPNIFDAKVFKNRFVIHQPVRELLQSFLNLEEFATINIADGRQVVYQPQARWLSKEKKEEIICYVTALLENFDAFSIGDIDLADRVRRKLEEEFRRYDPALLLDTEELHSDDLLKDIISGIAIADKDCIDVVKAHPRIFPRLVEIIYSDDTQTFNIENEDIRNCLIEIALGIDLQADLEQKKFLRLLQFPKIDQAGIVELLNKFSLEEKRQFLSVVCSYKPQEELNPIINTCCKAPLRVVQQILALPKNQLKIPLLKVSTHISESVLDMLLELPDEEQIAICRLIQSRSDVISDSKKLDNIIRFFSHSPLSKNKKLEMIVFAIELDFLSHDIIAHTLEDVSEARVERFLQVCKFLYLKVKNSDFSIFCLSAHSTCLPLVTVGRLMDFWSSLPSKINICNLRASLLSKWEASPKFNLAASLVKLGNKRSKFRDGTEKCDIFKAIIFLPESERDAILDLCRPYITSGRYKDLEIANIITQVGNLTPAQRVKYLPVLETVYLHRKDRDAYSFPVNLDRLLLWEDMELDSLSGMDTKKFTKFLEFVDIIPKELRTDSINRFRATEEGGDFNTEDFILELWRESRDLTLAESLLRQRAAETGRSIAINLLRAIFNLSASVRADILNRSEGKYITSDRYEDADLINIIKDLVKVPVEQTERYLSIIDRVYIPREDRCNFIFPRNLYRLLAWGDAEIDRLLSVRETIFLHYVDFIPIEWANHAIDNFRECEGFRSIISPENEEAYFRHFKTLLESIEMEEVADYSDILKKTFVDTHYLDMDHPMAQFIINKYILSHPEAKDSKNPYLVYKRVKEARQEAFAVPVPYEDGLRCNLERIEELTDRMIKLYPRETYGELKASCGGRLVNKAALQEVFNNIKRRCQRDGKSDVDITRTIREIGIRLRTIEALRDNLSEDNITQSWLVTGDDGETITNGEIIKFNRYLHHLLTSDSFSDEINEGEFFSERERAILEFSNTFHACATGRQEQLAILYASLSQARITSSAEEQSFEKYIHDLYSNFLINFLEKNEAFLAEAVEGPSTVHDAAYIKHMIARRLGVDYDITLDPHTGTIRTALIEKGPQQLLQIALKHLKPSVIIEYFIKQLNKDLQEGRSDIVGFTPDAVAISKHNAISRFLWENFLDKAADYFPGWNRVALLEDVGREEELISSSGVEATLERLGFLSRQDDTARAAGEGEVDIVSRGVDAAGSLIMA